MTVPDVDRAVGTGASCSTKRDGRRRFACALQAVAFQRAERDGLRLGRSRASGSPSRARGWWLVSGGNAKAGGEWERMSRAWAASQCICATSDGRSAKVTSLRKCATNSTSMR